MSAVKAMHVLERVVWALDSSHDIVLAHMIEAASEMEAVPAEWLDLWRVVATVPDYALDLPSPMSDHDRRLLLDVVAAARDRESPTALWCPTTS